MKETGCLLIGACDSAILDMLSRGLRERGAAVIRIAGSGSLLADAQKGLYAASQAGRRVCVAAEGEMWAPALALGIQLHVDRIALLFPRETAKRGRSAERLNGYVRRNLFFCVSDVLVLEDAQMQRSMETLMKRMINAGVWRMQSEKSNAAAMAAARFLLDEDLSQMAEN